MMKRSSPSVSTPIKRRTIISAGAFAAAAATLPGLAKAQAAPRKGGTLRLSSGGDPPTFDLHQSPTYLTEFLGSPCYSTLLRTDPNDYSKLVPDLAEAMDISADGMVVTFHLRPDAQFHNGEMLIADDVVYSINRIANPPKGIVSPRKGLLGNIASIVATDPHTVAVHLKQPQADFPFLVSNPYNVIYCKKVVEPLDATGQGMKRTIMGTGPFKLDKAIDGQIYETVRFDKYYGAPAYLDRLQFFVIGGEIERAAALKGNRIDGSFFFSSDAVLNTLRADKNVVALRRPTPTFINLIFNVQKKPFDDIRVRQALSLAVDRTAFIKTMGPLAGAFYHSKGLLAPDSVYSLTDDELRQFSGYDTLPGLGGDINTNRKKAMELLAQAGVPKGFAIVLPTRSDLPAFRDSCINVAEQLNTIGLNVTVDVRDSGGFYVAESGPNFQMTAHSVGTSGSLPDQILGEGYTSFGGRNYGNWVDPSLDQAYFAQSKELDPTKRIQLIKQFQLDFMKTYYQVNLAWVGYGAAYSKNLRGWKAQPDLYTNMQMNQVWLDT